MASGHWVHDLWPYHSLRRSSLFTEKEKTLTSPTWFSQSRIPRDAFPPWTEHITLLFCGKSPRMWVTTWVGSCLVLMAEPDLQRMTQLAHSLQVKGNMERAWIWEKGLVFLIWKHLFLIPHFFFYISMNHLKKWNTIILEQLYLMSWFLYRNQMFRNFTFIFYRKASNSTSNLSSSKSSSNLRMDVDMNTVQINIYYNFTNTHPRTVPQYWRNEVKGHFPAVVHTVCC